MVHKDPLDSFTFDLAHCLTCPREETALKLFEGTVNRLRTSLVKLAAVKKKENLKKEQVVFFLVLSFFCDRQVCKSARDLWRC